MTQDMIKTIRTIKMINNGKSAQREPSLPCTSHEAQTVRLGRTTTQARADHQSGWGGLWRSALLLLVMMMTFGINVSWGTVVDYNLPNGYYYIASNTSYSETFTDNFYMCPAKKSTVNEQNYLGGDSNFPLITTCKTFNGNTGNDEPYTYAIWYVEAATGEGNAGCYYIKHVESGKYLFANDNTSPNASRRRVNLGANSIPESEEDKDPYLFKIQTENGGTTILISPKTKHDDVSTSGKDKKYLNPSKANYDKLYAGTNNDNTEGIIGFWWETNNSNSLWHFNNAQCATPVITYDNTNHKLTITCESEANIYYTTIEGLDEPSDPSAPDDLYEDEFTITTTTTIKAIAHNDNKVDSEPVVRKIVLNPTINLTIPEGGYTYDGTAKRPAVSVVASETTIDANEYEVSYSNNTNAGTTATVTITSKDGSDYYFFGTTTVTFIINRADITPSMSVDDWSYGDTKSTPVITGNSGEGGVTYEYKENGADNGTYKDAVPTAIGNYTVRANIAETTNYNAGSTTADFSITQKSLGDGTDPATGISVDVTYNGSAYTVTVKQGESTPLTEGESDDYTKAGGPSANGKYYEVTITGQGNYKGSFTAKYALMKFDHKAASGEFTGTFVSDVDDGDFAVPNGMNAYIITDIRPAVDQVVAVRVDYIPEGVPVLLLYEDDASASPANGFLVKPKNEEITTVSTNKNLLRVTTTSTHFGTAEIYLLYKGEFVLNMVGDLAAGKIYLDNTTSGAHSSRLTIVWDESTGVEDVSEKKEDGRDGKWYTLDGRRLSDKPTKKGLYIRNREKRVVK